jgi:hypothetical protein
MIHIVHSHRWIGLALLATAALPGNSSATTIYIDKNDFMSKLESSHEEDFQSYPPNASLGTNSQTISGNGFSYEITASSNLWVASYDGGSNLAINTMDYRDTITIRFTSDNVQAVGGNFFIMDDSAFQSVELSLMLSDGTQISYTPASPSDFRGFIASGSTLFTMLELSLSSTAQLYATLDNLVVGASPAAVGTTPEPASLLLFGIGAAGLGAVSRKSATAHDRAISPF